MLQDDFDTQYSLLLEASIDLVRRANGDLQETLMADVGRESMPQIPVWRLHIGATSTFLGVIQCLRTRHSSIGAFSLLRGLIEAWTHLYFIADNSEDDTPAIRSIRFEAGVLNEWASVDKAMNPELDFAELQKKNNAKILRLCVANGRNNLPKMRTHNHVKPTLDKMAQSETLGSLDIFHQATSIAVHMSATDYLLKSTDTGVTVIWASPALRCAWLQLAIAFFDYLTFSALSCVPESTPNAVIKSLHERWQEIYNDPLLVETLREEKSKRSDA